MSKRYSSNDNEYYEKLQNSTTSPESVTSGFKKIKYDNVMQSSLQLSSTSSSLSSPPSPSPLSSSTSHLEATVIEKNQMASDLAGKWTCPQCTYANYQTATLCTMCRTPRHSLFITEPPCTSSTVCNTDTGVSKNGFNADGTRVRWPCPDCTFLNVLKSRHCTVCMCKRPTIYELEAKTQLIFKEESSIDLDQIEKLGKALHKWDCSQCTYKNWPNVKHCTMCGAPKDYVSVGIGNSDTDEHVELGAACCTVAKEKEVEEQPENATSTAKETADEKTEQNDVKTNKDSVEKEPSLFEKYLAQLNRSVDTGCASFLAAFAELLRQGGDAESKLIHYIYHYGESNRRINGLETMLLNSIDEEAASCAFNRTIVDIVRSKNSRILSSVPRFFIDSLSFAVTLPGIAGSDRADEFHKKIRESMYEDYDMTRVANNNALFTLPSAIYDLRPWVASGESSLRVLMDFDDRQVIDTVCCVDAHSLSGPVGCQTYVPLILRNRGGGHSLVDAVSQALWGVIDRSNTLRDALYHTLYAMETDFRSRWASSLMKLGLNFDIWMMQRHWSSIIECNEPGSPLESIHVLVLAQVLNRPIIVFPIESSKLNPFPARIARSDRSKHPVEGFYPQLPGLNSFRLCSPVLLGYINGNFYALILPPHPVIGLGRVETGRQSRIYRYFRAPPYPLSEYVQFTMNQKEADDIIKDNIVVDVDQNGQQWIYHSTFGSTHSKNELGFLLWRDWIKSHFPKTIHDDEVEDIVATPEENNTQEVDRIRSESP